MLQTKYGKDFKTLDELALLPPYEIILLIAVGDLVKLKRQKPVQTRLDYNLVLSSLISGV